MSSFDPGNGALSATNKPAALLELAQQIVADEALMSEEDRSNQVQIMVDVQAQAVVIVATLPFQFSPVGNGLAIVPTNYLDGAVVPSAPSAAGLAYIASQSSVYNNTIGTYANLNDDNEATGALTNTEGGVDSWLQATFLEPVVVVGVTVAGGTVPTAGLIAAANPGLNQSRLQYSTDNATWIDVLAISGVADSGSNRVKAFALAEPLTAQYWRLAGNGYVGTTEFKFT